MVSKEKFKLSDEFVSGYENKKAPFGFNGLGELTYMRTYSRIKENGENEKWHETIRRVVEGTYTIQKRWIKSNKLKWNEKKGRESAEEMYDLIFNMKFLPPGRGLWTMGTEIIEERGLSAALNNCAFCTTENIDKEGSAPFTFLMDASMLGVGVGFDTKGAGKIAIKQPTKEIDVIISDDREGWVESVRLLIDSFFFGQDKPKFDYSLIREEGAPIKGFGGVSSGPGPLIELHNHIDKILTARIGNDISVTDIVDIMNLIGKAVVAGNVRRSAELALGSADSGEYMNLKNYEVNPHRAEYGWTSNNSVFGEIGMDYHDIAQRIKYNGEPGIVWLDAIQKFSRFVDLVDNKDRRASGTNPCGEQSLEDKELCCLVENFLNNINSKQEFLRVLKFAYLYAKTVTLCMTHWEETNEVMLRNRRIGCSVSGLAQFVTKHGTEVLRDWLESGYEYLDKLDNIYSEWLKVPNSIKMTSNKPSGTVSLVAGATPGIHYPESRFYIRRMRLGKNSDLVKPLKKAGYKVEPCFGSEESTVVVEIPVDVGEGIRTLDDVSMWEQLALAAFMQKYWADNQVSCTITFDPKTEGDQIEHALNYYQYQLKSISFLPKLEHGAYPQMPYEAITEEKFAEINSKIKQLNFNNISGEEAAVEKYCNNDSCIL